MREPNHKSSYFGCLYRITQMFSCFVFAACFLGPWFSIRLGSGAVGRVLRFTVVDMHHKPLETRDTLRCVQETFGFA